MATFTQELNGDVSQSVTLQSSAGTFFDQINDGVTDGSTYNRNDASETNANGLYELANIPSDFGDLQTGGDKIEVNLNVNNIGTDNDTIAFFTTLRTAGGTDISDKVQCATQASSGALTVTLTGITLGEEASLADDNRLYLEWEYNKLQQPGNRQLEIYDIELFWTYTVAAPNPTAVGTYTGYIYEFD